MQLYVAKVVAYAFESDGSIRMTAFFNRSHASSKSGERYYRAGALDSLTGQLNTTVVSPRDSKQGSDPWKCKRGVALSERQHARAGGFAHRRQGRRRHYTGGSGGLAQAPVVGWRDERPEEAAAS